MSGIYSWDYMLNIITDFTDKWIWQEAARSMKITIKVEAILDFLSNNYYITH